MRKKLICLMAIAAAVFAACGKDNITSVTDSGVDDTTGASHGSGDSYSDLDVDRVVTVVYNGTSATVSGAGSEQAVSVSGAGVTITNSGSEKVEYRLSGSSTDGYFKVYSSAHQALLLGGLSLTNSAGAAINLQGANETHTTGKNTYIVLGGTNSVADGASYTNTPDDEDEKGAVFAEGSLVFSGSGSLAVTATGKSGIASDDEVEVQGGTITVSSSAATKATGSDTLKVSGVKAQDGFVMSGGSLTVSCTGTGARGLSGDGTATVSGGTLRVTVSGSNFGSSSSGRGGHGGGPGGHGGNSSAGGVGAKGMKFGGDIVFNGGTVVVSAASHEAIESKGSITVNSGEVYATSTSDDAINSASTMTIAGGYVCAISAGNDGLDANGNLYIDGGFVYAAGASSPELAIDANTEGGYKLYVRGGTIVAVGGMESGAQLSQGCYSTSSWSRGAWYSMTVGSNTYAFKTPTSGGSTMVVSGSQQPALKSGVSATGGTSHFDGLMLEGPTVSGGNNVTLNSYSR